MPIKLRIKYYPRVTNGPDKGKPIDNKSWIEFTTTSDNVRPLFTDILDRPYTVFDGSMWYPCYRHELEILTEGEENDHEKE